MRLHVSQSIMEHLEGKYFIKNNHLLNAADFNPYITSAGRSVYEVIRIVNGIPLFMEEHLERLKSSVILINQPLFVSADEIRRQVQDLIEQCAMHEGNVKLTLHFSQDATEPPHDFYVYFIEHFYPAEDEYHGGVDTITFKAVRNNPNAKVADLELRERVNLEIKKRNVFEAILLDDEGFITEGSRSNIFMIKDSCIYTTPLLNVLPGITRSKILEICRLQNHKLVEKRLNPAELAEMDAVFLTGTSPKILPIKRVDDMIFASASHPLVIAVMEQYDDLVASYINNYL
ncbi:MAG: aminotransferase, class [Firmicutes bacterium]|nr:aminotransferase, class [Bacillota bacterium]